jgi:uncharacterized SAM-binding protein YcdF (DUF218 family)
MTEREKFIVLVDNDKIEISDAIILLEGDGYNRIDTAVELYKNKYAPVIVFSGEIDNPDYGSYPSRKIMPALQKKGVAKKDILHEYRSQNTREQAIEVIKMAISKEWKRLILVASHYHQYRAFLTFLKVIKENNSDIKIYNVPARQLDWFVETGWGKRIELLQNEFNKIEQYYKNGHIATFSEALEYQKWKEEQI